MKGCVQNLKREFADLAVGMAVFTGQIRQLVLQYRHWCLIDELSPNSLFAAEKCITGSKLSTYARQMLISLFPFPGLT